MSITVSLHRERVLAAQRSRCVLTMQKGMPRMDEEMFARLQRDVGTRTLGQHIEERHWARQKIHQLQQELDTLRQSVARTCKAPVPPTKVEPSSPAQLIRTGELVRLLGSPG